MIMAHKLVRPSSLVLVIAAMSVWSLPLMSSAVAQETTTQPTSPVQQNGGASGSSAAVPAMTAASSTAASKKIPLAAPFTVPPEEYLPAASALPTPTPEDYAGAGLGGGGPGGFGPNGFGYNGPLFFNSAHAAAPSSGCVAAVLMALLVAYASAMHA